MKTFKHLKFLKFQHNMIGCESKMIFENGYGISVVRFKSKCGFFSSYTSNESEWEIAVLKGTKEKWDICYTTEITDDVIGHLSEEEVTDIMIKIQKL